ncbi:hypothetical protein EIKCOROL_02207 [Eikenella corrodens ATCC 23834]|uniref:Uncharacterized protein n=1 Tax=Eikenella corrodens ATCC 23834 TaxID=546274 RepID=C0DXU6_EIKCO|nr:hypothetical protein EIKCOROL_02207 [Eikenella corrodens ATCC 23834]
MHKWFSSRNKWHYKRSRYSLPNWQRLPESRNGLQLALSLAPGYLKTICFHYNSPFTPIIFR